MYLVQRTLKNVCDSSSVIKVTWPVGSVVAGDTHERGDDAIRHFNETRLGVGEPSQTTVRIDLVSVETNWSAMSQVVGIASLWLFTFTPILHLCNNPALSALHSLPTERFITCFVSLSALLSPTYTQAVFYPSLHRSYFPPWPIESFVFFFLSPSHCVTSCLTFSIYISSSSVNFAKCFLLVASPPPPPFTLFP